LRKKEIINA
jgi:hypothetical protein